MKRLLASFTLFIICLLGIGQEPESFNYQTVIHDDAGKVLALHPVSIKVSILLGSIEDSMVYSEKHFVTTNKVGLVTLPIGEGTDKTGDFTSIDWNADKYFLKVELDVNGGSNYTDIGTSQILIISGKKTLKATKKTIHIAAEDRLYISRKYVGNFLDYRQTGPATSNGPNLIWIKTSLDRTYGKISALGKKCDFSVGDKLYIKRYYYSPGEVSGYWVYQIENDSSVYYRLTDYQYDHKVKVESWFK
jgi:hypothetical protein